MPKKKVFLLIPDGVGLRNFAYTNFYKLAGEMDFDITFWNHTPFDLTALGYKEIKVVDAQIHAMTNIYKKARVTLDLSGNIKKTNDRVYDTYRFPLSYKTLKESLKSLALNAVVLLNSSRKGVENVRRKIVGYERKTPCYRRCLEVLQGEKPDLVFCSNQRTVSAIASIEAAKTLGIPTATFIFSWDNLPKGMLALETDYYFVWSDHMKNELLFYYDYITEDQIFVTGTPQFEPHADLGNIVSRPDFFAEYKLDPSKKYICYSGDDITTSPNDQQFLADAAEAILELNRQGKNLGLIFRRCPVDFSNRYNPVLEQYKEVIIPIDPKWEQTGGNWNSILPTKADLNLQLNTIAHTEMVINLGSSMVFDFAAFGKPCAYINYNQPNPDQPRWNINTIYNFVHFRSMPSKKAVIWLNSRESLAENINFALEESSGTVMEAQRWFEKINRHPIKDASSRILKGFDQIIRAKK